MQVSLSPSLGAWLAQGTDLQEQQRDSGHQKLHPGPTVSEGATQEAGTLSQRRVGLSGRGPHRSPKACEARRQGDQALLCQRLFLF